MTYLEKYLKYKKKYFQMKRSFDQTSDDSSKLAIGLSKRRKLTVSKKMSLAQIYTTVDDELVSQKIKKEDGQTFIKFRQEDIKTLDVVYDGSYWCDPNNGIVNAEWTLKNKFNYYQIFDNNLFKSDLQHILNFCVLPNNYPYGEKILYVGSSASSYASIKVKFDFRNARVQKEYFRYLNFIWVSKYQNTVSVNLILL